MLLLFTGNERTECAIAKFNSTLHISIDKRYVYAKIVKIPLSFCYKDLDYNPIYNLPNLPDIYPVLYMHLHI